MFRVFSKGDVKWATAKAQYTAAHVFFRADCASVTLDSSYPATATLHHDGTQTPIDREDAIAFLRWWDVEAEVAEKPKTVKVLTLMARVGDKWQMLRRVGDDGAWESVEVASFSPETNLPWVLIETTEVAR